MLVSGVGVEFVVPDHFSAAHRETARLVDLGFLEAASYTNSSSHWVQLSSHAYGREMWIELGWVEGLDQSTLRDVSGVDSLRDPTVDCHHFLRNAPAPSRLEWVRSADSEWTTGFLQVAGFASPLPHKILAYQGVSGGFQNWILTFTRGHRTYFMHVDPAGLASDDWELMRLTWKWM